MENKRFIKPEALVIKFYDDDIILTSGEGDVGGGINYPWWGGDTGLPGNPFDR